MKEPLRKKQFQLANRQENNVCLPFPQTVESRSVKLDFPLKKNKANMSKCNLNLKSVVTVFTNSLMVVQQSRKQKNENVVTERVNGF